jgi:3-hydroxybutyryl-CoA dehydrogenase
MAVTPHKVGVIGAGLMGHGIAEVFAAAGAEVSVFDPDDAALATLRERIGTVLAAVGEPADVVRRVRPVGSIAEAAAGAELVVEAAPENLGLKQRIFAELDGAAPPEAILATNTSVIPVGEIGARASRPERVLGTHWWNPPYLVPLVEVIEAQRTDPANVARAIELLEGAGKTAVHVRRDVPGFVGNRLQHAMWREALSIIDAGICDPETVDLVVRQGFGGRLAAIGPIENADLIGLDLTEAIHEYVLPHLDRSTEPARGLRERVAAGRLGAKSGRGYLRWEEGAADAVRERLIEHMAGASAAAEA